MVRTSIWSLDLAAIATVRRHWRLLLLLLHLGSHCHILLLLHLLLLQLLLVVFLLVWHHLRLSVLVVRLLAWVHALLTHALVFPCIFVVHLWHNAECLLALELEVRVLGLLNLTVDTIDLELVGLDLRLVVLKFGDHLLELLASLLEVLLVDNELLGDFWATLLGQDVLQLNVELLLLLDEDIFLGDFLRLRDQPLLERLNLLDELVGFDVSRFELPPPVHVQRLAKFVLEEFSLLLLFEKLLLEQVDLAFQIWDALSLLLRVDELSLVVLDLVDEFDNVVDLLLVVDFTLLES